MLSLQNSNKMKAEKKSKDYKQPKHFPTSNLERMILMNPNLSQVSKANMLRVIKEEVDARALEDFLYEDSSDSSPDIGLHKAIRKPKPDKKPKSVKKSKPANRVETIGKTLPGGMLKPVSDLEPVDDLKDGGHRRSARLSRLVEEANSVEEHESIVKAETFEETGLAAVEMPKLGGLHEPIVKIELVESPDPLGTFKPIENFKSVEKLAPHTKSKPSRAPTPVAHSKLVEAAKPGEDAKEYQEMQPMRHFGVVFPDGIPWYIKTPTQVMSRTASDRKKEAARIHAHGFTVDKKCDKCKSQDYRCVAFDPFEKSFKAIKCARCVNLNIPCSLDTTDGRETLKEQMRVIGEGGEGEKGL